jgi:hypothetical protein
MDCKTVDMHGQTIRQKESRYEWINGQTDEKKDTENGKTDVKKDVEKWTNRWRERQKICMDKLTNRLAERQ